MENFNYYVVDFTVNGLPCAHSFQVRYLTWSDLEGLHQQCAGFNSREPGLYVEWPGMSLHRGNSLGTVMATDARYYGPYEDMDQLLAGLTLEFESDDRCCVQGIHGPMTRDQAEKMARDIENSDG